jgi:hypothetical protein
MPSDAAKMSSGRNVRVGVEMAAGTLEPLKFSARRPEIGLFHRRGNRPMLTIVPQFMCRFPAFPGFRLTHKVKADLNAGNFKKNVPTRGWRLKCVRL